MTKYTDTLGRVWYSDGQILTVGDYVGSSVGDANIRYLYNKHMDETKEIRNPGYAIRNGKIDLDALDFSEEEIQSVKYLMVHEAFNSTCMFILDCDETSDDLIILSDYIVYSESILYEVEDEYRQEFYPELISEFNRYVRHFDEEFYDVLDEQGTTELDDEVLTEAQYGVDIEYINEYNHMTVRNRDLDRLFEVMMPIYKEKLGYKE